MAAPASNFSLGWTKGGGGWQENLTGGRNEKDAHEALEKCHFYAEIVKFGLILTHFKYFWEARGCKKIFLG